MGYYLCIAMYLFSRKIIGWHLSSYYDVELTISAFKKFYSCRNISYGLMFHSDRGSEYTAFTFRRLLDSCNVVQSFSKKGYPFDNACCENFFKHLKKNRVNRKKYHSADELHLDIFDYIENFYNNKASSWSYRLHEEAIYFAEKIYKFSFLCINY